MKVLLLKDITNIGSRGEVKEVKGGYFKNFLLPKNLAKVVTPKLLANLVQEQKKINSRVEKEKRRAEELLKKIGDLRLQVTLKEGASGQVFGSITKQKIIEALEEKNIALEKEHIELEEPLKTFGFHEIKLNFGHGVSGTIRIEIIPEVEKAKT